MGVCTARDRVHNSDHAFSWNIHPRKYDASQQWKKEALTGKAPTWIKLAPCEGCSFKKKNKGIKVVQDVEVVTDVHTDTIIEFSDINIQTY